jgi:integrase
MSVQEPIELSGATERQRDRRRLEPVKNNPGIYRRHAEGCDRRRCRCPYVVRWKDRDGRGHKQMFPRLDVAQEFKREQARKGTRRPLSSATVADHFPGWLENYRGRTSRGLEESSRREFETSFRLHIAPLSIAHIRMRDLGAPDLKEWFSALERRACSPNTIRKARAALAAMLADALEDGAITVNPAAGVRYVPSASTQREHPKREHRELTAADVKAILAVMEDRWQLFFLLLVQTGVRIGELLGLTWQHVHLGDDPHILVAEQVYKGQRKRLKTEASLANVPLSATMAAWLTEIRPDVSRTAPVFASITGSPLTYSNMYNRVLRPALRDAGIAVELGEGDWDYRGVGFHAFRKAAGSLLFAHGKTLKQVQGWLRHAQLSTTMNVYINQVDDGLGGADVWDDILGARGHRGATERPEAPPNPSPVGAPEAPSQ